MVYILDDSSEGYVICWSYGLWDEMNGDACQRASSGSLVVKSLMRFTWTWNPISLALQKEYSMR